MAADEGRGAHRGAGLTSVSMTLSMCPPCGTETSSAAPSKARSGTAITSASAPSACAAAVLQPATRTLQTSTSFTMASAAAREMTKTGAAAG